MPVFNVSATGFCPVFKDQRQIVITVEKPIFFRPVSNMPHAVTIALTLIPAQ